MSSDVTQSNNEKEITQTQNLISILWPSFLVASLTTILFFTFFDPHELGLISGYPDITRLAGYTIGFFLFWFFSAVSSALTCYFRRPCHFDNNVKKD
jgi:hypothetical protein